MGFLAHKKRNDDLSVVADYESLPAQYVREAISNAIHENSNEIKIENEGGRAVCQFNGAIVPYKNVRNRIAVMTDSIKSYDNTKDQSGTISIRIRLGDELVAYSISITDKMNGGGIVGKIHRT
jgi:hypothetical protein